MLATSFVFAMSSTASEWLSLRKSTALTVWPDLGGRLPSQSTPAASEPVPAFPDLTRLTWTIACEYFAQNSTVYHSVRTPGLLSDTVVVHHHGHAHGCTPTLPDSRCDSPRSFYDFYNITDFYHRELGADYFALYMPLFGPNAQAGLPEAHDWFSQWQDKGVPTLRFFLEPAILTINYALRLGYKQVVFAGKSGGGWTTTLVAALDPRVSLSFPIAGSIPLDFPHKSWDYEQRPRPGDPLWFLNQCNYTCLYGLATVDAAGAASRASLQILHEDDPCCYCTPPPPAPHAARGCVPCLTSACGEPQTAAAGTPPSGSTTPPSPRRCPPAAARARAPSARPSLTGTCTPSARWTGS